MTGFVDYTLRSDEWFLLYDPSVGRSAYVVAKWKVLPNALCALLAPAEVLTELAGKSVIRYDTGEAQEVVPLSDERVAEFRARASAEVDRVLLAIATANGLMQRRGQASFIDSNQLSSIFGSAVPRKLGRADVEDQVKLLSALCRSLREALAGKKSPIRVVIGTTPVLVCWGVGADTKSTEGQRIIPPKPKPAVAPSPVVEKPIKQAPLQPPVSLEPVTETIPPLPPTKNPPRRSDHPVESEVVFIVDESGFEVDEVAVDEMPEQTPGDTEGLAEATPPSNGWLYGCLGAIAAAILLALLMLVASWCIPSCGQPVAVPTPAHPANPNMPSAAALPPSQANPSTLQPPTAPAPSQASADASGSGDASDWKQRMIATARPAIVLIRTPDGSGSGFFVSNDGLVVTNAHVVKGSQTVQVFLDGGQGPLQAQVVRKLGDGEDLGIDLALVQVRDHAGAPLNSPSFLRVETPQLGMDVVALGYPWAPSDQEINEWTLTTTSGSVNREVIEADIVYLDHSARLLPGNSGGPLVDRNGMVVGINVAYAMGGNEHRDIPVFLAIHVRYIEQLIQP